MTAFWQTVAAVGIVLAAVAYLAGRVVRRARNPQACPHCPSCAARRPGAERAEVVRFGRDSER